MKIIIVGASGRIGKEVDKALSGSHEIVRVGVHSGDVQCDYTDTESVRGMFEVIGEFDSLISVAGGDSTFKPFQDLDDEDYRYGFERKFLGQIRFLRLGESIVRDNGSFIFTSGFLSHYPNGQLNEQITFAKGQRAGDYEKYYDNGQLEIKASHKDNEKDGPFETYYNNGQVWKKGAYDIGKLDGPIEEYFNNGQLKESITWQDGKKDGPFEQYYENGQLKTTGYYKNDEKDGTFELYEENGELKEKVNYDS